MLFSQLLPKRLSFPRSKTWTVLGLKLGTFFEGISNFVGLRQFAKATSCGVGLDSVACLGICDFNMPTARQKQVCGNLIEGISIINSSGNPSLNSTLAIFPDYARDSCPHGLYDEEKAIIEGCFGLRMHLDTRFIDLHTPQQRSEGKSSMRRFSQGRVIVNQDTVAANIWMNSELSVFGRPINADEQSAGAPTTLLPKSSSLVLPEGSSPNSDLKISERVRPSVEQQSAQKGVCRFQALIESMVKLVPVPGPLLIVNITGYVEECAAAATWIVLSTLCFNFNVCSYRY